MFSLNTEWLGEPSFCDVFYLTPSEDSLSGIFFSRRYGVNHLGGPEQPSATHLYLGVGLRTIDLCLLTPQARLPSAIFFFFLTAWRVSYHDAGVSLVVVGGVHALEPLLACCIPEVCNKNTTLSAQWG